MADRIKDKVALVTGAGSIGTGWGNGEAATATAELIHIDDLRRRPVLA